MTDDANDAAAPTTFLVTAYRCRCGHEWVPADLRQTDPPRVCPKCKSPNWNRPYQFRRPDLRGPRPPIVGVTNDRERRKRRRRST